MKSNDMKIRSNGHEGYHEGSHYERESPEVVMMSGE
jgi:hypothetical protein